MSYIQPQAFNYKAFFFLLTAAGELYLYHHTTHNLQLLAKDIQSIAKMQSCLFLALTTLGEIYAYNFINELAFPEKKFYCKNNTSEKFVAIVSHIDAIFAFTEADNVYAYGHNNYKKLGIGKDCVIVDSFMPVVSPISETITSIEIASKNTYFLMASGKLFISGSAIGSKLRKQTNYAIPTQKILAKTRIKNFRIVHSNNSLLFIDDHDKLSLYADGRIHKISISAKKNTTYPLCQFFTNQTRTQQGYLTQTGQLFLHDYHEVATAIPLLTGGNTWNTYQLKITEIKIDARIVFVLHFDAFIVLLSANHDIYLELNGSCTHIESYHELNASFRTVLKDIIFRQYALYQAEQQRLAMPNLKQRQAMLLASKTGHFTDIEIIELNETIQANIDTLHTDEAYKARLTKLTSLDIPAAYRLSAVSYASQITKYRYSSLLMAAADKGDSDALACIMAWLPDKHKSLAMKFLIDEVSHTRFYQDPIENKKTLLLRIYPIFKSTTDLSLLNDIYLYLNSAKNKSILNRHANNEFFDRLVGISHTRSYRRLLNSLRIYAYEQLHTKLTNLPADEALALLKQTRNLPLFAKTINNYQLNFFDRRTQVVKRIDDRILQLEKKSLPLLNKRVFF